MLYAKIYDTDVCAVERLRSYVRAVHVECSRCFLNVPYSGVHQRNAFMADLEGSLNAEFLGFQCHGRYMALRILRSEYHFDCCYFRVHIPSVHTVLPARSVYLLRRGDRLAGFPIPESYVVTQRVNQDQRTKYSLARQR